MPHSNVLAARLRACGAAPALAGGATSTLAQDARPERGRSLVTAVMACGNGHTPRNAEGRPVAGRELSGGGISFDAPPFSGTAANITPDPATGIGSWTDEEIERAMPPGLGRDGHTMRPPMACASYAGIRRDDLDAVVAGLRTLPLPDP